MKKYNSYKEVPSEYKWDLEDILKNTSLEKLQEEYFELFEKEIEIKDSKYNSKEEYLKFIELEDKRTLVAFKIENYLSNKLNINTVDPEINKLIVEFENKDNEFNIRLGSEVNRLEANKDKLQAWKDLPEFKNVKKDFEKVLNNLEHKLNPEVEQFLNEAASGNPSPYRIFSILDSSEIDFGYAISSKGKKQKITDGTRISLLKSKDEQTRKSTYNNYLLGFWKHRQSLAALLIQHFKEYTTMASIRKFPSSVSALISSDNVKQELLETIYSNVKKHMPMFHKFSKANRKYFKIKFKKDRKQWDSMLDLVDFKAEYSVEDAKQIFIDLMDVMPKRYKDVAVKAMSENWVDFINVPNKRGGAYSIGGHYGIDKKYILMNFNGSLDSVSTLCHEMGHSMHSYFSDLNQNIRRSQYPIFLAEIASIFNELMLSDYLIKKAKSDKEKFYILGESISDFAGTVIRQSQWSNYEFNLYKALDEKQPIATYEDLEKMYIEVANEYSVSGKKSKPGDYVNVYATMVPHYYYNFYVYKYSLGYIVANVFYNKFKKEGAKALEEYINKFLSAGDSLWPADILKNAGVDIYSDEIYQQAFENVEQKINEYIQLGNKIFKTK
ncbi:oligoendopeptidase F [[Mycoplasma] gypis]|uniref:Oligopeptidase F n=1 Tax=[Mycoplasma] gypis TaxID=92404 RepID=A0ABZ2RUA9_9BACT|nr:oligoendopeptidase F [[Mycoplasma] gypis]MBN0919550.1 oligoendopeptidase F [[Mycoplasma] gypis]